MRLACDQTFHSFVPGARSSEAHATAIALARGRAGAPRLLLLFGPPGVGKTHLLRAILDFARRRYAVAIPETSTAELIQRVIGRHDEHPSSLGRQQAEWLVVDDLHLLAGKPVTQAEVARLLKTVVGRGGRVACATGGSLTRITALVEVVQGVTSAKAVEVRPPKPDEMRRILAMRAEAVGLRLGARTLAALTDQGRGDVRRAIGALTHLRFKKSLRAQAELR